MTYKPAPPHGFVPSPTRPSSYNDMVGPFFEKREDGRISLGLYVEPRHCNARGICHGGLLSSLADVGLGYSALLGGAAHGATGFVTVNLSLDFAGSAKVGDWLETQANVQKAGRNLAFVNGFVLASGKPIVRASAVFALSGTLAKKAPADG